MPGQGKEPLLQKNGRFAYVGKRLSPLFKDAGIPQDGFLQLLHPRNFRLVEGLLGAKGLQFSSLRLDLVGQLFLPSGISLDALDERRAFGIDRLQNAAEQKR